jgi:preprotein translocase subunit SecA
MRVFASETLKKVMGSFKIPEDEPIESSIITRSIETAQGRIEGFNFDARKQVLAYDDVMNTQRLAIYARRRAALLGTSDMVEEVVRNFIVDDAVLGATLDSKKQELGAEAVPGLLRRLILQITDTFWLEHLDTMDYLRRSVSLRAYGQRDPLIEYRREGLSRFRSMEEGIAQAIREAIPRLMLSDDTRVRQEEAKTRASLMAAGANESGTQAPIVKTGEHGRNDMVTIKKGDQTQTLKFKKAELLLAQGWEILP